MKKLLYIPLLLAVIAGCGEQDETPAGGKLAVPELTVESTDDYVLTVAWEPVDNAVYYVYTLNGGDEKKTSQPEAEFSDCEPGETYTVRVKAAADGWEDSDWAEISYAFEAEHSWIVLEGSLQEKEVDGNMCYRWNAVFGLLKGTGVASVKFALGDNTLMGIPDRQLEELISETSGIALSAEEIEAVNSPDGFEKAFPMLVPESEYVFVVLAENESGEKAFFTEYITTDAFGGDIPDNIAPWIGEWNVASSQSMVWEENGPVYVEETIMFPVSVALDPVTMQPVMSGWCREFPDIAMPCAVNESGALELLSGSVAATLYDDYDNEYDATWLACVKYGDGIADIIPETIAAYTMTLEGDMARSVAYTGTYDGEEFTVNGLDLFALSGDNLSWLTDSTPAGTITMTKASSEAPAAVFRTLNSPDVLSIGGTAGCRLRIK